MQLELGDLSHPTISTLVKDHTNGGLGNHGGGGISLTPTPPNAAALFVMCRVSPKTLLTFCTNGVLLRTLMGGSGPLATVTHVIVVSMHRHTCMPLSTLMSVIMVSICPERERERTLVLPSTMGKLVRSEVALLLLTYYIESKLIPG